MTPITKRPCPAGYTTEWDSSIWNIGFTFQWSEFYQQYMREGSITIKPGQTLAEAFESVIGEPMWPEYEIFFVEDE